MVLWSRQVKTLTAVELTVSWEENCHAANERKTLKYADMMEECREKGWRVSLFPVEIGCRGFPGQSVWKLMTSLRMVSSARNTAARQLAEATEKASCYIVGMASTRRAKLDAWERVVVWPPLLTRQLEDAMVKDRNIGEGWRSSDDNSRQRVWQSQVGHGQYAITYDLEYHLL